MAGWDKYNHELIDKSHKNSWEVDLTHALVRHLVRQGAYATEDIEVLTPYTGQLRALRSKFNTEYEVVLNERDEDELEIEDALNNELANGKKKPLGTHTTKISQLLRLATVDNFQGEEAKIIVVSLVRSNNYRQVGFLKTTNRINVLLSRAQHGLFLIGNTDTYSRVDIWYEVLEMLFKSNCVGTAFNLCCPRHPGTIIKASRPEDFVRLSPEGGYTEKCGQRLQDCGHTCQSPCHSERMHSVAPCAEPCPLKHEPCGHKCTGFCNDPCGDCRAKVKATLPCGHESDMVECHMSKNPVGVKCSFMVDKEVAGCKHITKVPCSEDVKSPFYKCPELCRAILPCGHTCPIPCRSNLCKVIDHRGRMISAHPSCKKICGKKAGNCDHTCPKTCHDGQACKDGSDCQSPCNVSYLNSLQE